MILPALLSDATAAQAGTMVVRGAVLSVLFVVAYPLGTLGAYVEGIPLGASAGLLMLADRRRQHGRAARRRAGRRRARQHRALRDPRGGRRPHRALDALAGRADAEPDRGRRGYQANDTVNPPSQTIV